MTAQDEYDRIWDMLIETHQRVHEDHRPPVGDMNCCGEYAVMMALRAASAVKPDYPSYLLLRIASLPELDKDFYVKNILSTDGEPEPVGGEPQREYRAARRHHILWNELKTAAARIEELEMQLERPAKGVPAPEG